MARATIRCPFASQAICRKEIASGIASRRKMAKMLRFWTRPWREVLDERKPYNRAVTMAVKAMVRKLVTNSINAPPNTAMFQVANPKPITASGGISAVAMATPTIVPSRPWIMA